MIVFLQEEITKISEEARGLFPGNKYRSEKEMSKVTSAIAVLLFPRVTSAGEYWSKLQDKFMKHGFPNSSVAFPVGKPLDNCKKYSRIGEYLEFNPKLEAACLVGYMLAVVVLGSHTSWYRLMTSKNIKYMGQVEQYFNNIRFLGVYDRKFHEMFTINPRFSKDYSNDYTCLEEYFDKEIVKEDDESGGEDEAGLSEREGEGKDKSKASWQVNDNRLMKMLDSMYDLGEGENDHNCLRLQ